MSELNVRGIPIKFPYEKPYDIQETYMSKVIDCLEDVSVAKIKLIY